MMSLWSFPFALADNVHFKSHCLCYPVLISELCIIVLRPPSHSYSPHLLPHKSFAVCLKQQRFIRKDREELKCSWKIPSLKNRQKKAHWGARDLIEGSRSRGAQGAVPCQGEAWGPCGRSKITGHRFSSPLIFPIGRVLLLLLLWMKNRLDGHSLRARAYPRGPALLSGADSAIGELGVRLKALHVLLQSSWRTLHPAVEWAGWYPQEDAAPWEKTLFAHPVSSDASLRNEGLVL